MKFFKKISLRYISFLIILYLSFTLTGCPSAPSTEPEIDLDLVEFNDTLKTYMELVEKQDALVQEYNEYVHKLNAIEDDLEDLDPTMDFFLLKREVFKLSQNALDILEEQQKILDKQMDYNYDQSRIISKLQGNIVKITDPSKKSLTQEISDKLREMHNLMFERTELYEKEVEYFYSNWEDLRSAFLNKITFERALKNKEERLEKIEENKERIEELWKTIRSLATEISDLKAKLDSLGSYK